MASVTICEVCDTDLESDPNMTYMNVTPIGTTGFHGSFRVECSTVEDTQRWIAAFQENSKMTFRVSRTRPSTGHRVLYNYDFRCIHNTMPRTFSADLKKSSKNTNCPAEMTVRLLKSEFKHKGLNSHLADYKRKSQSKDLHLPKYPLCITLDMNHNHAIDAGDALRCRDVGPEARSKIEHLLQNNHSPSSALKVLKYDLQVEHPENYLIYAADRHHCPDLKWCYRLYYDSFRKQRGPASGSVQLDDIDHSSDEDNQSAADETEQMFARESVPVNVATVDSKILNRFQKAASKIQDMYKYDPVRLGPALEAFCTEAENISTASAMQSALNCFGKYVGAGRRLASLKTIGVRPTAITRRKAALGGRKRTCLGRTHSLK